MPSHRQTKVDRAHILANLPEGVRRVQVIDANGKQVYKKPSEVDASIDEIVLNSDGAPIVMRGKPGRKSKSTLKAVTPQIAEVEQARAEHLSTDPLRRAAKRNAEGEDVFNALIAAMAEEAASVEFDKAETARHGGDTATLSAKRARILKGMADTWLKRKQQVAGGSIDLDSPAFKALFGMILEMFKVAMVESGSRPEHIETVFAKLVASLGQESWKQEARARMKAGV